MRVGDNQHKKEGVQSCSTSLAEAGEKLNVSRRSVASATKVQDPDNARCLVLRFFFSLSFIVGRDLDLAFGEVRLRLPFLFLSDTL